MRKENEIKGLGDKPKYFVECIDEDTGEKGYKYVGDYWGDRKKKDWSKLDDIF